MRTFECPICGWMSSRNAPPAFEMASGRGGAIRLAAKCMGPDCAFVDPVLVAADFNEGLASHKDGRTEVVQTPSSSSHAPRATITASAPISTPERAAAAYTQPLRPDNVVEMIAQRHTFLVAEIARLEGMVSAFKSESKKLGKMLGAAARVAASEAASAAPRDNTFEGH